MKIWGLLSFYIGAGMISGWLSAEVSFWLGIGALFLFIGFRFLLLEIVAILKAGGK